MLPRKIPKMVLTAFKDVVKEVVKKMLHNETSLHQNKDHENEMFNEIGKCSIFR